MATQQITNDKTLTNDKIKTENIKIKAGFKY